VARCFPAGADTITLKQLNPNSYEATLKKAVSFTVETLGPNRGTYLPGAPGAALGGWQPL
jgi:hypothetical protein